MRNAALITAMIVGMATWCSCSNSNEEIPVDYTDTPVSVNAGVYSASIRTRYDGTDFAEGDKFGLFFDTEGLTTGVTNFNKYRTYNTAVTYNGSSWDIGTQLLWKNNTTKVKYFAYCPYDASVSVSTSSAIEYITASKTATISRVQTTETMRAEDFMFATCQESTATKSGESEKDGTISINFAHKLAKLNVVVGSNLKDAKIEEVDIENLYTYKSFSLTGGEWDDSSIDATKMKTYTRLVKTKDATTSDGGENAAQASFTGLIIPQTMKLQVRVYVSGVKSIESASTETDKNTYTTSDKEYTYTYKKSNTEDYTVTIEGGKIYTLKFLIKGSENNDVQTTSNYYIDGYKVDETYNDTAISSEW